MTFQHIHIEVIVDPYCYFDEDAVKVQARAKSGERMALSGPMKVTADDHGLIVREAGALASSACRKMIDDMKRSATEGT